MKKIKVSTYTDESGQDTKGSLFVVCTIIVLAENGQILEKELNDVEIKSNKKIKSYKTNNLNRQKYVKNIIKLKSLNKIQIYYSVFKNKLDYSSLLGSHIAKAIIDATDNKEYKAKIFIDKTNNAVLERIKKEIKLYKIRYQKIRGLSDKSSSLIRLADSCCGLIRDLNNKDAKEFYKILFRRFREV
jgi:hypothetical protein